MDVLPKEELLSRIPFAEYIYDSRDIAHEFPVNSIEDFINFEVLKYENELIEDEQDSAVLGESYFVGLVTNFRARIEHQFGVGTYKED